MNAKHKSSSASLSAADIEGRWVEPDFESGLIVRCREAWHKPLMELTNNELATFLRQQIAVEHVLPLAIQRVKDNFVDDTELFDGELATAIVGHAESIVS